MLKNTNAIVSGLKRFMDIDGSIVEGDKVEDIFHSRWKVLQCIRRNNHSAIERDGKPQVESVVGDASE